MPNLKEIMIDLDVHRVIESNRQSFSETENCILRRLLLPRQAEELPSVKPQAPKLSPAAEVYQPRVRGAWNVVVDQSSQEALSLIDAYKTLLLLLQAQEEDFLERFSKEGTWARRYVAKSPRDLYLNSPKLESHGQPLIDGWYFDTNLSEVQIRSRAEAAAAVCGLSFGTHVKLDEAT